jgi:hypothetical protein
MADQDFECYQCWDQKRISVVINKEAVSVDRATFMATHAPMNSIAYLNAPRQIKDTSEAKLLEELRSRAEDDLHTFCVIQGIPGTGKSHLIRWLKERYAALNQETGGSDVILLIERANSSLRSTLLQIIQSDVFDSSMFSDQLDRLKSATDQLSKRGLADTILNNLQVATNEVVLKESEQPSSRIRRNIEKFLLDYVIREELKEEGGPIERIVRFLAGQDRTALSDDEMPTFQASDFGFQIDFLRKIKNQQDGYLEAKKLAESLNLKPELREELATYLNRLLSFAIGLTTALSADELKQMFNDLRRELRQQGRQLALFIEDIAVFTGLDAGLVDVLATQHTGEGNREFCRLLSMVGITDGYYTDHFPDNMKQRITHRLTLNTSNQGQLESHLLTQPHAVADLAARYLNAIRLSQDELEAWQLRGAQPDRLPSRCYSCTFRPTCHAAFGYAEIANATEDGALRIGLYPFNQRALWTMYSRIDTSKNSRTPRTLLNNVIEYVLQSHGRQISQGQFPPMSRDLGSDFSPPTLEKPAQRSIITGQSGSPDAANRIETLSLFWGNRTVDATVDTDGQQLVGGLRKEVFDAFGLPFIDGDGVVTPAPPVAPPKPTTPPPTPTPVTQPAAQPQPEDPLTTDIERWRTGSKLQNYEKLVDRLFEFAGSFIDWETYHIPASLVEDRLKRAKFVIEDQAGRSRRSHRLEFKRSDELALVLHALSDLHGDVQTLEPSKLGSHITTLSSWMRGQEPRIVQFVRQPGTESGSSLSLCEALVQNNLLMACLGDELEPDSSTPQDLFFELVEASPIARSASWGELIESAPKTHSSVWVRSMKNIERNVDQLRRELFPSFNCAQGRSKDLRFLDAATALDLLDGFTEQNWKLEAIDINPDGDLWTSVTDTYKVLQQYFVQALKYDLQQLQDYLQRLRNIIGEDSAEDVLRAISDLLENLRQNQIGYSFEENTDLTATRLEECLTSLQGIPVEGETMKLALWLSGAGQLMRDTKEYLDYLERFHRVADAIEKQLTKKIQDLRSSSGGVPIDQKVENQYQGIRQSLAHILELSTSKEKAQ